MATKDFYATGDFRYANRMLRAGDGPVAMDGPTARLYTALGKISRTPPKKAAPAPETTEAPTEEKPKRAPRKRTAKKAK